ncbi:MAG: hypothetical protein WA913_05215 [Pricia sp.]
MGSKHKIDEQTQKLLTGLERSYQKLVEFKKYKKSPLVIEKDGVILEIQPDEIPLTTTYTAHD